MTLIDEVRSTARLPEASTARLIRISAGISQERLAAEVGVHRVTLARWESGECRPRGTARSRYSTVLHEIRRELQVSA